MANDTRLDGAADAAFHDAMKSAGVSALWERPPRPNTPIESPHIWHWDTLDPLLDTAVAATTTETAERRVLCLDNPAFEGTEREGASINLSVNLQVIMPGETARPHRHTMNALRFVLESDRAATIVDGKRCEMAPGDMILTPGWSWHAHEHPGTGRAVWVDALDVPLHKHLDTGVFEPGPPHDVPELPPDAAFATAGLVPILPDGGVEYSPLFRYRYEDAAKALAAMPAGEDGARKLRYVHPVTGGPAMTAIDCFLVGYDSNAETRPVRSTSNAVCVVVEGEGQSRIGDDTLSWRKNDIFTVPHGHWASHKARSDTATVFAITDRDILARFGLLHDELRD